MNLHEDENVVVEKEGSSPSNDMHDDDDAMNEANEAPKVPKQTFPKPYTAPLLFPKRMTKAILDFTIWEVHRGP